MVILKSGSTTPRFGKHLKRLTIVPAGLRSYVGIKPQKGEIADIFIISPAQITELLFHDPSRVPEYEEIYGQTPSPEQVEIAESNREMAVGLCWKPYMYDLRLPGLLNRVTIPTRIVWGRDDRLVPLECAELYQKAIPGSDLVVVENCGHLPQVEKPHSVVFARRKTRHSKSITGQLVLQSYGESKCRQRESRD